MKKYNFTEAVRQNRGGLIGIAAGLALLASGCGSKQNFGDTMAMRFDGLASGKTRVFPRTGLRTVTVHSSDQLVLNEQKGFDGNSNYKNYNLDAAADVCGTVEINGQGSAVDKLSADGGNLRSAEELFLDGESVQSVEVKGSKAAAEKRLQAADEYFRRAEILCDDLLMQVVGKQTLIVPVGLK